MSTYLPLVLIRKLPAKFTKKYFLIECYQNFSSLKKVIHFVFLNDNAKGFISLFSEVPIDISKYFEIAFKENQNVKKMFKSISEAVLAKCTHINLKNKKFLHPQCI